jgi:Radical SAM superfamily
MSMSESTSHLKPNLLCIVPPYLYMGAPPLGPAALLAYLRQSGCDDFDFLDLRLWAPNAYAPTYQPSGVFGETYVLDVPDLPLVLKLIANYSSGRELTPPSADHLFERYCLERGISADFLASYLRSMHVFLGEFFACLDNVAFIGFSVWTSNFLTTLMAAAHLKRRKNSPLIVFGGPQVSQSPSSAKLALQSGLADLVAVGEGEETLLRIYELFRASRGIPGDLVPGTHRFNASRQVFEMASRPLLRLPSLPLPAFDKLPLSSYWLKDHALRTVTYELSRGCTDKCTFCSEWVFWQRMRIGDTQRAVSGMADLVGLFRAERIWFMDSLLNAKPALLGKLAEEIIRSGISIQWGGYMRANVDQETAAQLKAAGCEFAFVGVESLADDTLALMNKRRTNHDNITALRSLLRAGLKHVVAGFIPGFPGDTRGNVLGTALALRALKREFPHSFRVNVEPFSVSPAQPLYTSLHDNGLTPHPWADDFLALAPAFANITNDIVCHVSGSNQGLDRIGELHIARTVTASERRPTLPDPFFYSEPESLVADALEISEIQAGIYFGRAKSDYGLCYGVIMTYAEKAELERRTDYLTFNLADDDDRPRLLPNRQLHNAFIETLETRHIVTPSRTHPAIKRAIYTHELTDSAALYLSPAAAARSITTEGLESILIVDSVTLNSARLPCRFSNILALLARRTLTAKDFPPLGDSSGACNSLESLVEKGLLRIEGI